MDNISIEQLYIKGRNLYTVTIELINECNWHCKHCYLDNNKMELPPSMVYEIIDNARELGGYNIKLSGGEITIYPYLDRVIEYARKRHMNVTLITNMSNISDSTISVIDKYGIDRIETTLFSVNPEIHDNFVGSKGAFDKSFSNLKKLREKGVKIIIKTWAVKSNVKELREMETFFAPYGFEFSVGTQIYNDIHGKMKLPPEERLCASEYAYALSLEDRNREFPLDSSVDDYMCDELRNRLYITASGDIVPCAKLRTPLGSVYHTTLKAVWEDSTELHRIQELKYSDNKECVSCESRKYCFRCGAMSYFKGKKYEENCEATCLLAKIRSTNYKSDPEGDIY